jgi:hypothetical protein
MAGQKSIAISRNRELFAKETLFRAVWRVRLLCAKFVAPCEDFAANIRSFCLRPTAALCSL